MGKEISYLAGNYTTDYVIVWETELTKGVEIFRQGKNKGGCFGEIRLCEARNTGL